MELVPTRQWRSSFNPNGWRDGDLRAPRPIDFFSVYSFFFKFSDPFLEPFYLTEKGGTLTFFFNFYFHEKPCTNPMNRT